MYEIQKNSMASYYQKMKLQGDRLADDICNERFFTIQTSIFDIMDAFYKENPDTPTILLKSRLHTLMAEYFEPVIFACNPFFFEMGMREADSWGLSSINPGTWLHKRIRKKIHAEYPVVPELENQFQPVYDLEALGLCSADSSFDGDHHTLGYTNMFRHGLNGLIAQATEQMERFDAGSDEYYFCLAAIESCQAVIAIANKFADKATQMLAECTDENEKHFLSMMAESASYIPANPPRTFYEGLALLLFTREIASTLEAIGYHSLDMWTDCFIRFTKQTLQKDVLPKMKQGNLSASGCFIPTLSLIWSTIPGRRPAPASSLADVMKTRLLFSI